ncbi:Nickel-containing superoxide dismutase [Posidoniimonas polymericola]|uniref:Nickel-containing superoxide dismutase n=1 Tax=Posidoniimonas polymericola TaxID=2528002 RepID=A0A5C5YCT3_9BACT|nr:superoxide dismutase [Ni] [Posidoniimonas polymericola]TWT73506.1 Nickel-containing superoxide dismutase [Posidoniimonas polymericola]
MKSILSAVALAAVLVVPQIAAAHCQVPCGIYGDQRRFDEMLEDTETIAKAITQIGELSGTHDATGHNQLSRWVATKEAHASNIQEIIGQYFLAQRIKSDNPKYVEQLKAAHGVIVAAMKTKQAADPKTATDLEAAIKDLYRAYEGKEPVAEAKPATPAKTVAATVSVHSHDGEPAHSH